MSGCGVAWEVRSIRKNLPISSTTVRPVPSAGRRWAVLLVAWLVGVTAVFGAGCSSGSIPSTTGAVPTTATSAASTTVTSTSPVGDAGVAFVELLATALDSRDDARLILYPDLNHLFMTGQGMSTPAEYEQPGHVAAQVIRDISSWIDASPPR